MAMLLDVNDFCRFCQENCRLGGTLSNTKKIWETKDPDDVFHRLLKIGLILQPRDQKSSRICRKCFRFILRIEESLSTLQKWKSAEEENASEQVSQEETPKEVKKEIDLPPTPDRTQPTTQCLTEVMIPYPTKQICPTPVVGIVESVCKGHWAKAANLIMKLDALADKIKECVLTAVDKECKTICHYEQDCMLWRCSPEDLKALSFDKMESDLQRLAPFLFSLLSTITNRSPPQICAAASIALRGRNPRLSAFAYHINGVLFDAGAKEAVFEGLSKFGISTSHYSAVKKQHSLEDISGDELQRLTVENELHLKPQPERTEDTASDSDEEEDVSSVSVNTEETYSSEAESSETEEMPAVFDHAQRVLSSLNQQRATGRFCDAALNVGDGVVHLAHRNILACFSDLFQQPNEPPAPGMELCLQECPNDGLELLLNFVYTGELKLDPHNLDKVQNAAASLCVPEALALCQQFKETCADPGPFKRKRGRPRKSTLNTTTHFPVKKENLPKITNVESIVDTAKASFSTATTTTTSSQATTTRCGRLVKGPRRLVTDEMPTTDLTAPEKASKKSPLTPTEGEVGEVLVEKPNLDRSSGETKELHSNANEKVVGEVIEEDDEEDDVGELDGAPLDTDEEYVPVAEPSSSASSTATARKRKAAQSKADREENGEAAEEDSKKDCVQCPTCDKSFKSKYYLKVHNRRHTGERPFGCLKCGKRYFRKENLLIHEIRDCSKVQTFSCETCSETFNSKEELRMHVFSHTGEMPHKCSICNEQFLYKKNLTTHMMKVHGHPKPHACPQCPKTFLTRTELRVHEAAKHRGEKPFVCEECGHRASSRNGLQMHIKAIHRNERPFVCSLCGHAFSQKNNLNMHLRIHSGERPYQCHLCGKTFRTQASLDKHNRTHTGERPFPCDVCEQRFTEKGALVRHKASKHEEGRPHCCHICGKTFKAKEQFRVHLRRHKGMRKFECTDCGYKFTRQSHLRRHTQIHKRTENYNPRQRKLRNVIVTDVNRSPDGNEDIDAGETSLIAGETDYVTETAETQESTTSSIERVVIESEDVAPNQNPGSVEGAETFPVPDVLQPTQLDTEAFEPTIDMEGMVEGISESKT